MSGQEDSVLSKMVPQAVEHVDCEIWYNYMFNRYKGKSGSMAQRYRNCLISAYKS